MIDPSELAPPRPAASPLGLARHGQFRRGIAVFSGTVALACGGLGWANVVTNGSFMTGLQGWLTSGSVFGTGGQAAINDTGSARSALWQPVPVSSGVYLLSFDVRGLLSAEAPFGGLLDTFFASLYFGAEVDAFSADRVPPNGLGLLDLDATGYSNVSGTLSISATGGNFFRFEREVTVTEGFLFPVFELYDLNAGAGTSTVVLDNVSLVLIPEPAAWLVPLTALAAAFWRWRRFH
jgi:hypothetical protein